MNVNQINEDVVNSILLIQPSQATNSRRRLVTVSALHPPGPSPSISTRRLLALPSVRLRKSWRSSSETTPWLPPRRSLLLTATKTAPCAALRILVPELAPESPAGERANTGPVPH